MRGERVYECVMFMRARVCVNCNDHIWYGYLRNAWKDMESSRKHKNMLFYCNALVGTVSVTKKWLLLIPCVLLLNSILHSYFFELGLNEWLWLLGCIIHCITHVLYIAQLPNCVASIHHQGSYSIYAGRCVFATMRWRAGAVTLTVTIVKLCFELNWRVRVEP